MRAGSRRLRLLALLLLVLSVSSSAQADLGVRLESGTLVPYEAPAEAGTAAGLMLTYDLGDLQIGVGGAWAFPGSQTEAPLVAGHLLAQWHPLRSLAWFDDAALSPYLSLGIGLASLAEPTAAASTFDPETSVRWMRGEEEVLGLLGLGVSYGSPDLLYLSAEARAVNHTHLGLLLGAGAHF